MDSEPFLFIRTLQLSINIAAHSITHKTFPRSNSIVIGMGQHNSLDQRVLFLRLGGRN